MGPWCSAEGLFSYYIFFHLAFLIQSFERVKLLLMHLAKAYTVEAGQGSFSFPGKWEVFLGQFQ